MDDERILGELKEFKRATEKKLERIEVKVDNLERWKWKRVGEQGAIAAAVSAFFFWFFGK